MARDPMVAFAGAVLCGGASRRMGRDKAFVTVAGEAMVTRVARAMEQAGAVGVVTVGGDRPRLADLGLVPVDDDHPGQGPLGGVLTALRVAGHDPVLVTSCDLVHPSATAMAATVRALAGAPTAGGAVPVVDGHRQWTHAVWRWTAARPLAAQLASGERGLGRAVTASGLGVVEVLDVDGDALADADTPTDLPDG